MEKTPSGASRIVAHKVVHTFLSLPIACLFTLAVSSSEAGTLITRNHEKIEGELLSLDHRGVRWKTRYKGVLVVPIDRIHNLETLSLFDVIFKNERHERRCQLMWTIEFTTLQCDGNAALLFLPSNVMSMAPARAEPVERVQRGGSLELSLRSTRKEIQETFSELSVDGFWRHGKVKHNAELSLEHESEEGNTTLDHREYQYQLDYFYLKHWYALALAHRLSEPSNDHFYEETLGVGLGREWIVNQHFHAVTELVAGGIGRHYRSQADIRYDGFRWHAQMEYRPTKVNVVFEHEQIYAADVNGVNLRQFRSDNTLKVPLQDTLQAFLKYRYEHVDGAPDTFVTPQHETSVGVSYDW